MLFRITRHCEMNCLFCMVDAKPDNRHMEIDTIIDSLNFIKKVEPKIIVVTGGEPFSHPKIFFILEQLLQMYDPKQIIVATNGMPLQSPEVLERALALQVGLQITNDSRYYPTDISISDPRVEITRRISAPVFPAGRALTSGLECGDRYSPQCFNIRSICRRGNATSLKGAVSLLESMNKFCTPAIDHDGTIKVGENGNCKAVGTVTTALDQLFDQIVNFRCKGCGLIDRLPQAYRQVIGEA